MPLTTSGLNDAVNGVTATITHIALTNGSGTELTGGSYARLPVTWATASGGTRRPSADLAFNVPAGTTVGGWKGFTALTGGTEKASGTLTSEAYASAGTYVLEAASTGITIS